MSSARSARSSISRSSGSSPSSTRCRSPQRRSARCTARRCPTAGASSSRCSGRTRRKQIEADLSLMYQAAEARQGTHPCARLHRRERDRRRVRALDPAGARLPAGGAERRRVPQELRRPSARRGAEGLLVVHALARADARVPRRRAARRHRRRAVDARPAAPARVPGHRGVDDDDLPPRVLPRRPSPGEHPRALARPDRARRLRAHRQAHRRRHVEADAALHRRRGGEHRGAAEAPRRPRRPLPEGARGAVRRASSASSTTATTARASRRSTRSRSSARASR